MPEEEPKRRQPRRPSEVAKASPLRAATFRFPEDLLEEAKAKAAERGETLSAAMVDMMRKYVRR